MKKLFFFCAAAWLTCSISSAAENIDMAIEIRADDQFTGIIGKATYTGKAIEVVTFGKSIGREDSVLPSAYVYEILEKKTQKDGIYNVKCQNQLGIKFSGVMDLADFLHPKISLKSPSGILLVSISPEGTEMKKAYLPSMYLGN
ncbi:MAG: hypothetical protein HZA01_15535 [Nitrospinae bacterium]|nr:hypothetical protein [Nitrospinota bacterium]